MKRIAVTAISMVALGLVLCHAQQTISTYIYPAGTNIAISGSTIPIDTNLPNPFVMAKGGVVARTCSFIGTGTLHVLEINTAGTYFSTNPATGTILTNAPAYNTNDFPVTSGGSPYQSDWYNGLYTGPLFGYVQGGSGTAYYDVGRNDIPVKQ